ncbi:hypothetical protein HY498_01810 [Candidatus Woesearchaeota archaeon]|nr:hypothetical protein [Candidatus Woesearchaeota archaeon]
MSEKKREGLVVQIKNLISSLSDEERKEIIESFLKKRETGMPISVFRANISGLEIIIKYLREVEKKSFKEISKILNRKLSTVYNTYNRSKNKFNGELDISDYSICIPFNIFVDRKYSVLESIVAYLKVKDFSVNQISLLLNKNQSTIRTVLRRYKIKNG